MKSTPMRTPVLCLSLLALAACSSKEQGPPKMPTPTVGVFEAQPQNVPLTKDLVGRLSAYRSADVRARVSGVLLKRVYTEGTDVKQGQPLFQIDPVPYKAALANAEAALASSQASYTNAHVIANRDRQLVPQGYISRQQLDTDEANERSAQAAVKQAEANVQTARINLGYTNVTAPIDGRAGEQQVTEGAIVGNSTSDAGANATLLTTVDQLDPLYVNFTMSAADLETLRHAQSKGNVQLADQDKTTVEITLPSGVKYDKQGTLDFSDTSVNPTTGAINLRAVVPNPDRRILPGMYVTLTANMGELNKVFLIPQAGIQRDPAGAYALVVGQDGNVAQKRVSADTMLGHDWLVTNGLAAGDQVIVSGVQGVKPGAPAKATPWKPDQAPAGQDPAAAGHQ
ncbi:efflux RND transporter periplasmic adaptor subunit [Dyella nitratireducens]|uniref:Multidrug resistance protein n=1 Tax=Dyella nitratireducens TaxID=1849580 RepID=A0ABQ1GMA1_9GAMM|nr:efflux RND transporter periplasmic adaptor subunit [Dyella nitratireducens]GGA46612.1 multidrug resistance protein [Dyella nitratireducens]GLQ41472.1 multidrug resistance protein [Dyella nitratireducens]